MKTNHRRGFVERRRSRRNTMHSFFGGRGFNPKTVEVGDPDKVYADFPGFDHAKGHRGTAHAKRGAKKFLRTRLRFNENNNLRKILKDNEDGLSD